MCRKTPSALYQRNHMNHDSPDASAVAEELFNVNLTERQRCKFWNKIRLIGASDDDCHEWTRAATLLGYGVVRMEGRNFFAHRVAFFLSYGPFPNALKVCHKCDNPKCCRPDHLFLGTQADNLHDMFRKDRRPSAKGMGTAAAKLTDHQVREIRTRYSAGGHTHRSLAKEYGICHSAIYGIVNRIYWPHIL